MSSRQDDGETMSLIMGLIVGLAISLPIAAWLSPRSGSETRQGIRRRGFIIRHKAGEAMQQVQDQIEQIPAQVGQRFENAQHRIGDQINQLQEKVADIRGESVEDALEQGRAIAAQKRMETSL